MDEKIAVAAGNINLLKIEIGNRKNKRSRCKVIDHCQ